MSIADRRIEYETKGLDLADLAADPISQWWRWYDEAVAAECTEPNAAVVSTVDTHGLPDARYVLVRGVDNRGFVFFTNLTSAKAGQLHAHPAAALTIGWLQLHRQVRVRGTVSAASDAECDAYHASRPRESRIGAWASPQSSVITDRAALDALVVEQTERFVGVDDIERPPFWGGYRIEPSVIEFWQGRPSRLHDRLRYRYADRSWTLERLAP
jgi:pyridoxamine 5'-phosphate oxidase